MLQLVIIQKEGIFVLHYWVFVLNIHYSKVLVYVALNMVITFDCVDILDPRFHLIMFENC